MSLSRLMKQTGLGLSTFYFVATAQAGVSLWSFSPNTNPVVTIGATGTAVVSYTVTNNSKKTHQLVLSSETPTGIRQMGPCTIEPRGSAHSSCTLTLSINASALPENNISGGPILCQTNRDGAPNSDQCYQPDPDDILVITRTAATTLSTSIPSSSILALSVNDLSLGSALTGHPRQITIENTGLNEATGLTITYPAWPGGSSATTASSTCGPVLAAGNTCVITVTPGTNPTSDCNTGVAPTPGTITVSATNVTTAATTKVVVLSYGCIYQGGFLFSVDDSYTNYPISGSIGGTVVSLTDQANPFVDSSTPPGPGIIWSSNGNGFTNADVSYDIIPLIAESPVNADYSTAQTTFNNTYSNTGIYPFPLSSAFAACDGAIDGVCNSGNILALYSLYRTNYGIGGGPTYTLQTGATPAADYAAGLCSNYSIDSSGNSPCTTGTCYNQWYLPAICELDSTNEGSISCPSIQSIVSNLSFLIGNPGSSTPSTSCNPPGGTNCFAGNYWSSTESSLDPQNKIWVEGFSSIHGNYQGDATSKETQVGVRCLRILS